ncbi:MAG: type II secretion system F family protein [Actinomycetia bacterium]|nr:type II secretion system F family protein [Actinomycetes bacterium]
MTVAAVLLAAAVLWGGGPSIVRGRVGILPGRGNRAAPRTGVARTGRDPFAAASALDVLAVCLAAGMTVAAAADATAAFAPPELAALLRRAADLLALGSDPDTAWQVHSADSGEECVALARLARRSASAGSALADGLAELAEQQRSNAGNAASAAAERAGVLIAGPLGLCFLPAFLCLGIVPVVAGLAGEILGVALQ